MRFGWPQHLHGVESLTLVSLLLLSSPSPVAATSQEQQVLGNGPVQEPETTAWKCIPQDKVHAVMRERGTYEYYSGSQLDKPSDDPEYIAVAQICYTRHPELRFSARTTYHDRTFDVIVQNGPARGFDAKHMSDDITSFVEEEIENAEEMLAKLHDDESSFEEEVEETDLLGTTISSMLSRIESCHDLIRELSASDSTEDVEPATADIPIELRSLTEEYEMTCIWPAAPDYDARITRHRKEQCDFCIGRSQRFNFSTPLEPVEKMDEVQVQVQVRAKGPAGEERNNAPALSHAAINHKNENFLLNLNPFTWLYGYEMAEALVFDWVQRLEHACTWDELPKDEFVPGELGTLQRLPDPCKEMEEVEAVRHEIQTLCEPTVRNLLADVPNHGLVVDRGVERSLRIVLQDGKPTCVPYEYERTTKPETESCRYQDDRTRFSTMLERIREDERARAALEDVPIVPANIVELDQKWGSQNALVDGISFHFRHMLQGFYDDSVPDVMSRLRVFHWAKSHPDEAAHLHVQALRGIVVDARGCYKGMLIEPVDKPLGSISSWCLYQCSRPQQEQWFLSLRQDMQLLRQGPEIDETLVDLASVAIDKDDQTWFVDFKGSHGLDTLGETHIGLYDAKRIVWALSEELGSEHSEEEQSDGSKLDPGTLTGLADEVGRDISGSDESSSSSSNSSEESEDLATSSPPVELSPDLSIPEDDDDALLPSLSYTSSAFAFSTLIDLNINLQGLSLQAYILGPNADKQVEELGVSGLATLSKEQYQKLFESKTDDSELIKRLWSKHVGLFVMEQCGDFVRQIFGHKSLFGLGKNGRANHIRFGVARDEAKGYLRCVRADKYISPV